MTRREEGERRRKLWLIAKEPCVTLMTIMGASIKRSNVVWRSVMNESGTRVFVCGSSFDRVSILKTLWTRITTVVIPINPAAKVFHRRQPGVSSLSSFFFFTVIMRARTSMTYVKPFTAIWGNYERKDWRNKRSGKSVRHDDIEEKEKESRAWEIWNNKPSERGITENGEIKLSL